MKFWIIKGKAKSLVIKNQQLSTRFSIYLMSKGQKGEEWEIAPPLDNINLEKKIAFCGTRIRNQEKEKFMLPPIPRNLIYAIL